MKEFTISVLTTDYAEPTGHSPWSDQKVKVNAVDPTVAVWSVIATYTSNGYEVEQVKEVEDARVGLAPFQVYELKKGNMYVDIFLSRLSR